MKINKEDAIEAVTNGHEDFSVIEDKIIDQRRWETTHEVVVKHIPTNKYYSTYYHLGSTECQESEWFYEDPVEFDEVEQQEKKVIVWVPVTNKE